MGKLKDAINAVLQKYVVRTLVEKVPVLKLLFSFIDGHKTEIGKIGILISLFLAATQHAFPNIPYIDEINTYYAMIIAWLMQEIGQIHRADKEAREALFQEELDQTA